MRISTQQFFQRSAQGLGASQTALLESQQRLSGGAQRLRASDAPSDAQASLRLTAGLDRLARFERNRESAELRLNTEETTLAALAQNLQRVRELALTLGNATLTEEDALGVQAELKALKSEALALANTKAPTGEALFAGTNGTAKAFAEGADGAVTYLGTATPRQIQIGPDRTLELGPSGGKLFQSIANDRPAQVTLAESNSGTAVLENLELLDAPAFSGAALPLTVTFDGAGGVDEGTFQDGVLAVAGLKLALSGAPDNGDTLTISASSPGDLFALYDDLLAVSERPREPAAAQAQFQNALRAAQDRLADAEQQVGSARSAVGSKLSALEGEQTRQAAQRLELEAQRSALDDLDYTAAITLFQQQLTALQAAQSAFTRISDLSLFNFLR
jgi:flagellar hook-associated protein 3 FlgL